MNSLKALREHILRVHPGVITDLASPVHPEGFWSLDVDLADKHLSVQWSTATGFGISSASKENFAEGPDEVFPSLELAKGRVDKLLGTIERTSPPIGVALARLRERRGLTQQGLAQKLGIRQATISGLERRGDVQLSTLRRVVEGLGGVLEVYGSFPDAKYSLNSQSPATLHQSGAECAGPSPATGAISVGPNAFESLRIAGTLPDAYKIAKMIGDRRSVMEIP